MKSPSCFYLCKCSAGLELLQEPQNPVVITMPVTLTKFRMVWKKYRHTEFATSVPPGTLSMEDLVWHKSFIVKPVCTLQALLDKIKDI